VDGLVVSNHGAAPSETLAAAIDCLPEVVDAVAATRCFVDRSFRRGTDIYKALASGAERSESAPLHIWACRRLDREGVERVLEILRAELTLTMRQMGTPSIREITAARVLRA